MKLLRTLYLFLGSIHFALFLIASVTLFVISGTFLESFTQSHRYAALFTYSNPLFSLLLWGFFINILFSAIRRWPFRTRHIPFLITHFGLLMILGGTLAKYYFGLQGTLSILEGSGSHQMMESEAQSLLVENRATNTSNYYPLSRDLNKKIKNNLVEENSGLHLRLINYMPHSTERLSSWIKGDFLWIQGLNVMPVHDIESDTVNEIPLSGRVAFSHSPTWNIYALRASDPSPVIEKLYLQGTKIRLIDRYSEAILFENLLVNALQNPMTWKDDEGVLRETKLNLNLDFSSVDGFDSPILEVFFSDSNGQYRQHIKIPLNDSQALYNLNTMTPHLGNLPWAIDLIRDPALIFIEDSQEDVHLVTFNSAGDVWSQSFRSDNLEKIMAYEGGYGGYTVSTSLNTFPFDRQKREEAMNRQLMSQLRKGIDEGSLLSPPLQFWQTACNKAKRDFIETLLEFLVFWNNSPSWLFPEEKFLSSNLVEVLKNLEWDLLPASIRQASEWTHLIFSQLEPSLQQGRDLIELLRETRWPLLALIESQRSFNGPCSPEETASLLTLLTQQIFAASDLSVKEKINGKEDSEELSLEKKAAWFSAYLRAYGIHLNSIIQPPTSEEMKELLKVYAEEKKLLSYHTDPIILETSLTPKHQSIPPGHKLEDNFPLIALQAKKGNFSQVITLAYDPSGNGLKWPILQGSYLVRFQPQYREIPYHIRLRNARQINYANSSQPYSFESDLLITERQTGKSIEQTISMNHVHETWDGYRFYLSSIAPPNEGAVKQVQIVVNYDPAKYLLTYPGAGILTLGIILLFWRRPYRH